MTCHSKTVYLKEGETLTFYIRTGLTDLLTTRYKILHMAEDMKVKPHTLYRFLNGSEVRGDFYDRAFIFLIKKSS